MGSKWAEHNGKRAESKWQGNHWHGKPRLDRRAGQTRRFRARIVAARRSSSTERTVCRARASGRARQRPVALYDGSGNRMSDFVGAAPPEDVRWFPDRSAVLVSVQGQQYTIDVESGNISNYTDLTSNPQFSAGTFAVAPIPEGVVVNSGFSPGEQLRVLVPYLNIRQEPSTTSGALAGLSSGILSPFLPGPMRMRVIVGGGYRRRIIFSVG